MTTKKTKAAETTKAIDPDAVSQLLEDAKSIAPLAQKVLVDLVAIFKGGAPKMAAAQPVKCGPDGESDSDACLECALHCQLHALAALVQAQGC